MSSSTKVLLSALALGALVVFPLMPTAAQRDLVQTLVIAASLGVAWRYLLERRDLAHRGIGTLVVAVTVLGTSDFAAAAETHLLGVEGGPRASSYIALAGYCLLGVGVFQFQRSRGQQGALPGGIEAAIFALGAVTPLLVFLVLPVLQDDDVTLARKAITVAFGVVDLAALTVVLRGVLTDARRSPAWVFLGGSVLTALAAASWNALSSAEEPSALVGVRLLFLLAFILFAAGIAHPSVRLATQGVSWDDPAPAKRWVWLMGIGQAMPLLTLGIVWLSGTSNGYEPVIAVAGLAVALLVLVRMSGFLDRIRQQSEQLAELARSDELTGLHNRRSWNYELRRACANAESRAETLAIGLIDLDHFKDYNDTHGHPAGDRLLRSVAETWQSILEPTEVLARYGGEEFAVLMPGAGLAEAAARLDALRLATPDGQTFSAGVAMWPHGTDPLVAVAAADEALYRAKRAGRNRVLVAEQPETDEAEAMLASLRVVLQPIVRVSDLAVVGYEVLSRFPHTDDVLEVFARAHDAGYGDRLEGAAIRNALGLTDRPAGARIHINVSELAMRSPRFWQELPTDLSAVVVELHEGRAGLDDGALVGYLDRLRRRGARIGLDDIGSRATDLPRIVTLRPDVVKIDRALVHACHLRPGRADVIRVLVEFARRRGADVCVEGVESGSELAVVRSTGVDLVQGYLVGRPEPGWPTRPHVGAVAAEA